MKMGNKLERHVEFTINGIKIITDIESARLILGICPNNMKKWVNPKSIVKDGRMGRPPLDREQIKCDMMNFIMSKGATGVQSKEIVKYINHSRNKVESLIHELKNEGKITKTRKWKGNWVERTMVAI